MVVRFLVIAVFALVGLCSSDAACGSGDASCADEDDVAMLQRAAKDETSSAVRRRKTCMAASGNDTTATADVAGPFKGIEVAGDFEVDLVQGVSDGVTITMDSGLLSYVTVVNVNGTLKISFAADLPCSDRDMNDPKITVSSTVFLSSISAAYDAHIYSEYSAIVGLLMIRASADSKVKVRGVTATAISVTALANAEVDLKHTTAKRMTLTAVEEAKVKKATTDSLTATVSGHADVELYVTTGPVMATVTANGKLEINSCTLTSKSPGVTVEKTTGGQVDFKC